MKKIISAYWPLALVLPLIVAAYLHLRGDATPGFHSTPLGADQLTAELARAVSYGLVGDEHENAARPMHAVVGLPAATAS